MKKQIQTFMRYRFLLEDLISRDLKVKYRRSVLGLIWSILNPLLMMLVVTTVFSTILRIQIENFPLYYLTGSLIFNFISEATSAALISIISSAQLIKKVYVPKYIFPLEKTLFSFVNMLFSLIAIVIIMVITPNTPWHWTLVLFPVPLIYALVFAIGLGLILASVNVFFRVAHRLDLFDPHHLHHRYASGKSALAHENQPVVSLCHLFPDAGDGWKCSSVYAGGAISRPHLLGVFPFIPVVGVNCL